MSESKTPYEKLLDEFKKIPNIVSSEDLDVHMLARRHLVSLVSKYKDSISYELWLKIIPMYEEALSYLPEQFRTIEMYDVALENNIDCYVYIPDDMKTLEQTVKVLNAILNKKCSVGKLDFVPPKFLSIDNVETLFVDACIEREVHYLEKGIMQLLSFESQRRLISFTSLFCCQVDPRITEYKDWLDFSSYTWCSLLDVPKEYKTRDVKLTCVVTNPDEFHNLDESDLDSEFIFLAVLNNYEVYRRVKDSMKTYELTQLYLRLLKKKKKPRTSARKIPKSHLTLEVKMSIKNLRLFDDEETLSDNEDDEEIHRWDELDDEEDTLPDNGDIHNSYELDDEEEEEVNCD